MSPIPGRPSNTIWIVPLAIAALVAAFGWWGNIWLRQTVETRLRSELKATLDANVTALEIWTTNQMKLAISLADESKFSELAMHVLAHGATTNNDAEPRRFSSSAEARELQRHLTNRLGKVGYGTAQLVSTNLVVVASFGDRRERLAHPVLEEHKSKYSELFSGSQPVIITPFKPPPPRNRPPPQFDRRPGPWNQPRQSNSLALPPGPFRNREISATNRLDRDPFPGQGPGVGTAGWRDRRGDPLMQVAAPIRDGSGVVKGALSLIINPDDEFTRILSIARSGDSGETYAFDQQGLMISRSRFDEALRKLGLIEDAVGSSSALNLRLGDPGEAGSKKFNPADAKSLARPLIRIVANAIEGHSGVDAKPYRDYRGVPVVGAWRWLPQHGFGVATQIDSTEAYQPLRVLTRLFVALVVLLTLCAISLFLFSYRNVAWRRRLKEVELQLRQLGQYTLEEKIGEGGMGAVYRARHALMRRDTAVKLLLPDRADAASIQRFEREVCLTCQLTHPNTIQVYDYGRTPEGIFYYAMEYLRGLNLRDLVVRHGSQPESRVIHLLVQICDSLSEAHNLGMVHRDIKPANVFLCARGGVADSVKVLDFGLVREYQGAANKDLHQTGEEHMLGTPLFMPPEAFKHAARSDPRSDLYSVGALGYFLLTGQNVFDADSTLELHEKHLTQTPLPPSRRTANLVSKDLESIILRCLERDPELRPQSAAELRDALSKLPRAAEWDGPARTAWWTRYQTNPASTTTATGNAADTPSQIDATVRIDMGRRE